MKTILFIHGFRSHGNSFKARLLKESMPDYDVYSPTIDFLHLTPDAVMLELQKIIESMPSKPTVVVGSSLGGYYALCCCFYYGIPVFLINPCVEPVKFIEQLIQQARADGDKSAEQHATQQRDAYRDFNASFFMQHHADDSLLNFALSLDDEVLGEHDLLETMFPRYNMKIMMNRSGHHFTRFDEILDMFRSVVEFYEKK